MAGARAGTGLGLGVLGACLGIALIYSTRLATETLFRIKTEQRTVEVKGFAERRITSDWAVWSGSFGVQAPRIEDAYRELERQRQEVLRFIAEQGFAGDAVELSPVATTTLYARDSEGNLTNRIEGYSLRIEAQVSSGEIDGVARLARESGELVKQGIAFSSSRPDYFFTRLDELKVEMLGEATADARRRAEALARNSGSGIGTLRHARQGVFQITPAYSAEVSDYGRYDTQAREKSIKAVVTIGYSIES